MNEKWQCQVCNDFISNDDGITTLNGLWVCDDKTCRTLDEDSQAREILKMGITMSYSQIERLGAKLYDIYRFRHQEGYPVAREFVANLDTMRLNTLRDGFISERKKYESESIFDHNESFWAMYGELQ